MKKNILIFILMALQYAAVANADEPVTPKLAPVAPGDFYCADFDGYAVFLQIDFRNKLEWARFAKRNCSNIPFPFPQNKPTLIGPGNYEEKSLDNSTSLFKFEIDGYSYQLKDGEENLPYGCHVDGNTLEAYCTGGWTKGFREIDTSKKIGDRWNDRIKLIWSDSESTPVVVTFNYWPAPQPKPESEKGLMTSPL